LKWVLDGEEDAKKVTWLPFGRKLVAFAAGDPNAGGKKAGEAKEGVYKGVKFPDFFPVVGGEAPTKSSNSSAARSAAAKSPKSSSTARTAWGTLERLF
jgi:hypothetical protein